MNRFIHAQDIKKSPPLVRDGLPPRVTILGLSKNHTPPCCRVGWPNLNYVSLSLAGCNVPEADVSSPSSTQTLWRRRVVPILPSVQGSDYPYDPTLDRHVFSSDLDWLHCVVGGVKCHGAVMHLEVF